MPVIGRKEEKLFGMEVRVGGTELDVLSWLKQQGRMLGIGGKVVL